MTDEMLKRRYSGTGATNYNELRQHSSRWRKEHEMVRAFLLPHKGKSVLDLPVGTGRFAEIYKAQFTNCMHGRAMAVARQARGEAFSSSSRWNHRRSLSRYLVATPR